MKQHRAAALFRDYVRDGRHLRAASYISRVENRALRDIPGIRSRANTAGRWYEINVGDTRSYMRRTRVRLHLTAEGRETAASSFRGIDLDRRIDSRSGRTYLRCKTRGAPAVTIAATARRTARLAFDGDAPDASEMPSVRTVSRRAPPSMQKKREKKGRKERGTIREATFQVAVFSRREPSSLLLSAPLSLYFSLSRSLFFPPLGRETLSDGRP